MGKKSHANGSKLRAIVNKHKICAKMFREAEDLARNIFNGGQYVPLPFYTEHGEEHCQAIERFIEQIIWKNGKARLNKKHDFIPSPEEAMYLLSAVWLHDLGMWYGILDNEPPEHLQDATRVIKLRDKHEVRASRYIHDKWARPDCSWQPLEKVWLANICAYHRGHIPMSDFQPVKERGRRIKVEQLRLGVLAALLRLADACHVDKGRAPQRVMGLYISLGMPGEARVHWERADLIRDVRFDHGNRSIELTGCYPREFPFGLGQFDVREVGEMICANVRRELRSVQQTLSAFSNTDLRDVKHIPYGLQTQDYRQKQQCLRLWPYFLSKPFSATQAVAALAQMLLLSVEQAEESGNLDEGWRNDMNQIMEKTKNFLRHDFMIRNLCIDVDKLLLRLSKKAKSATTLTRYLNRFLKSIEENCGKVVGRARRVIGVNDVLVVYGHSINIDRLLRDINKNHSIYIVDCYKPLDVYQVFDENKKILGIVKELGFSRYKFLQLESLSAALWELKRKQVQCKLLLGTHGRLKCGDLLCKVGSSIIAETVRRFGGEVIALCETTKFLSKSNKIQDSEIAGHEQLFSSEDEKKHPQMVDVPYVAPKMDRLPKKLIDMVITESGVERRRKLAMRGAGTGKVRSKGRKANKAK